MAQVPTLTPRPNGGDDSPRGRSDSPRELHGAGRGDKRARGKAKRDSKRAHKREKSQGAHGATVTSPRIPVAKTRRSRSGSFSGSIRKLLPGRRRESDGGSPRSETADEDTSSMSFGETEPVQLRSGPVDANESVLVLESVLASPRPPSTTPASMDTYLMTALARAQNNTVALRTYMDETMGALRSKVQTQAIRIETLNALLCKKASTSQIAPLTTSIEQQKAAVRWLTNEFARVAADVTRLDGNTETKPYRINIAHNILDGDLVLDGEDEIDRLLGFHSSSRAESKCCCPCVLL